MTEPSSYSRTSPAAVVCIPTFRRPEMLRATLTSLTQQTTQTAFNVVIVDNDAEEHEGSAVAQDFFAARALQGFALVEPKQGNCHAINCAFREARLRYPDVEYFLMIDDDEQAAPDWVAAMTAAAHKYDADIVGGPVFSRFTPNTPLALREHPVFQPPFSCSGSVPVIYGSGNCLIRRRLFDQLAEPDFDLRYNYLGGGDADFFARCQDIGARFYWEQDARIDETVPSNRLTTRWIVQRGLRIGAINYLLDRRRAVNGPMRLKLVVKMAATAPIAVIRAIREAIQGRPLLTILHPLIVAAGKLAAVFGIYPEQYRFTSSAPPP